MLEMLKVIVIMLNITIYTTTPSNSMDLTNSEADNHSPSSQVSITDNYLVEKMSDTQIAGLTQYQFMKLPKDVVHRILPQLSSSQVRNLEIVANKDNLKAEFGLDKIRSLSAFELNSLPPPHLHAVVNEASGMSYSDLKERIEQKRLTSHEISQLTCGHISLLTINQLRKLIAQVEILTKKKNNYF